MASVRVLLVASAALFSLCHGLQPFDSILSDPKECEESCVKSYSPHTNPHGGGESEACGRGCRLYTISEFVTRPEALTSDDGVPPQPALAKDSCYSACVEAYNKTSGNTVACKYGCEAQEENSKRAKESSDKAEDKDEGPSIHLLRPLVRVQSIYSSIMGTVHVVRSSIVTYFATEDNAIVAVEGAPNIAVEVVRDEDEEEGFKGADVMLDQEGRIRNAALAESESGEGGSSEPSVVKCMSQRLGVPPPLLVASTLVLVLFTIYVIFAVCTTASPPKASKEGLSVQSDPMPVPIKLVRPEDLTRLSLMEEDDLQAPPLPTKVKLPDTHV